MPLRLEEEEKLKCHCVCRSPCEKFNKVSNDRARMQKCDFYVYSFCAKLVQKIKNVSLSWNLVPRLIRVYRIQWWCSLFPLSTGNTLFRQIWSQNSKLLKVKSGISTNSNKQKSMVMLTFSIFDRKYPFWANLVQKTKIVSLSWNLVPRLIWKFRIQWCCSLFIFETKNNFIVQIWSKNSNLSV